MIGKYQDYKLKDLKKLIVRKIKFPFYSGNQFECSVCGAHFSRFKPIWKSFPRKLKEHGFIYPLEQFETMTWDAFMCPSCDCSDRERMYGLYLREWLTGQDRTGQDNYTGYCPFAFYLNMAENRKSNSLSFSRSL